jgi:hypothetical protein
MNNVTITLIVISAILLIVILRPREKSTDQCNCDFNDVECKTACSLKNRKKKVKFNNTIDKVKIL